MYLNYKIINGEKHHEEQHTEPCLKWQEPDGNTHPKSHISLKLQILRPHQTCRNHRYTSIISQWMNRFKDMLLEKKFAVSLTGTSTVHSDECPTDETSVFN